MPDIDDIWDDEEDMLIHSSNPIKPEPRLCRDIFDSNAEGFLAELTGKIATMKSIRANAKEGGDYWHTLDRYIGMLESAKIAAKAHMKISQREYQ